jgi:hypothetical protein
MDYGTTDYGILQEETERTEANHGWTQCGRAATKEPNREWTLIDTNFNH